MTGPSPDDVPNWFSADGNGADADDPDAGPVADDVPDWVEGMDLDSAESLGQPFTDPPTADPGPDPVDVGPETSDDADAGPETSDDPVAGTDHADASGTDADAEPEPEPDADAEPEPEPGVGTGADDADVLAPDQESGPDDGTGTRDAGTEEEPDARTVLSALAAASEEGTTAETAGTGDRKAESETTSTETSGPTASDGSETDRFRDDGAGRTGPDEGDGAGGDGEGSGGSSGFIGWLKSLFGL